MFEQAFKNIDDVLWKEAGCTTELDYTEQTSWLLFLKYLDDLEAERAMESELRGKRYEFLLDKPHHWASWAAQHPGRTHETSTTWPYASRGSPRTSCVPTWRRTGWSPARSISATARRASGPRCTFAIPTTT